MWLSWLERGTHNAEVGGSSPPIATIFFPQVNQNKSRLFSYFTMNKKNYGILPFLSMMISLHKLRDMKCGILFL